MIKLSLTLVFFFTSFAYSQPYTELTDTKPHDGEVVWNALKKGYYFAWGNTDTRYPKLSVPEKKGMENKDGSAHLIKLKAWRGERINAQAVIYTKMDSSPAEATWLGWHTAAGNYDGYLLWAYNSWTEKPLQDSRFKTWAAGDTYMVYPDVRPSVRFQRLIEGIQDFEKIRLLRKELGDSSKKMQSLNQMIATFTLQGKGDQSTENQVREARKLLNEI